ncbi:MAG: hypothetical protein K0R28_5020 [Paenibacillus sp.]|nr:hypothetical protein [Paenibacillus sp.]
MDALAQPIIFIILSLADSIMKLASREYSNAFLFVWNYRGR